MRTKSSTNQQIAAARKAGATWVVSHLRGVCCAQLQDGRIECGVQHRSAKAADEHCRKLNGGE